jgi:hypothetical protein
METERITVSQQERDRLKVLHEVQQKHLTQVAAAARLKVLWRDSFPFNSTIQLSERLRMAWSIASR